MATAESKDESQTLANSLLEIGKRAFDPSADSVAAEAAKGEFYALIDG